MEFRCGLFANFPCSPLSAISFSLFLSLNNCWVSNATKIIMLKNRAIFEWILRRGDLYCLSLRLLLYISAEYLLRAADKDSPFLQRDGFPFEELSLTLFIPYVVLNPVKSEILMTSPDVGLVFWPEQNTMTWIEVLVYAESESCRISTVETVLTSVFFSSCSE